MQEIDFTSIDPILDKFRPHPLPRSLPCPDPCAAPIAMDLTWAQALLAQGLTDADIAVRLYLSEGTVHNYTSAIFSKLVVSDCTQAVVAALRYGLVDPEE